MVKDPDLEEVFEAMDPFWEAAPPAVVSAREGVYYDLVAGVVTFIAYAVSRCALFG